MPCKINNKLKITEAGGKDIVIFILSLLLAFSIWLIHGLSLKYTEFVTVHVVAESGIDGHSAMSANSVAILARCRTSGYDNSPNHFSLSTQVKT